MALTTLQELLRDAMMKKLAIAAFNTTDLYVTESILRAAEDENAPVIVMVPSVALKGRKDISWYIDSTVSLIKASRIPACLHLDHSDSVEECIWASQAGFTGVMYDGSSLPFAENIENSRQVVKAAHALNVGVEAEIGHVGDAALDEGEQEDYYTSVEEADEFARRTRVDALAVAIGTAHGLYRGEVRLDFERLRKIRERVRVPLVMHGGSGLPADDFKKAIQNGINKINIFTTLSLNAGEACKELGKREGERPVHIMEFEQAMRVSVYETVKWHIEQFRVEEEAG
ncbi:MAG: class II fructose-bisphosphate aldolase [Lachnospiraceae bacterium]|nr:class II fructose-bisphosphate aldolase [Lachnospiraceae bacterium]